jgi:hypothetical protein
VVNGCFVACVLVLGPVTSATFYGGARGWAIVLVAQSIGIIVGGTIASRIAPAHPIMAAFVASSALVLPFVSLGLELPLFVTAPAALVCGIALAVFEVLWYTTLQQEIPADVLSRVSSYDTLVSSALVPVPVAVAVVAPLSLALANGHTLLLGALIVAASVIATLSVPAGRTIKSQSPVDQPSI